MVHSASGAKPLVEGRRFFFERLAMTNRVAGSRDSTPSVCLLRAARGPPTAGIAPRAACLEKGLLAFSLSLLQFLRRIEFALKLTWPVQPLVDASQLVMSIRTIGICP